MIRLEEFGIDARARLEPILWDWATSDHRARLLVGRDRRLLWANTAALDLLSDGEHLVSSHGVVNTPPQHQVEFARLCLEAQAHGCLCVGASPAPLLVVESFGVSPEVVALTAHRRTADQLRWAPFDAVFGLTPAEHRVILALLGGVDVGTYAAQVGASVLTMRTHVRRAYSKIGVGNREQLFRALVVFHLG